MGREAGGRKDRDGSHSPVLSGAIPEKGQGAAPTGKTRAAEAAIQPEWPVYTEAESRVEDREVGQGVVADDQPPLPAKPRHRCGNLPMSSILFHGLHSITIPLGRF